MPTALPTLMTVAEVAAYLQVSMLTVRREIRRGRLNCVYVGTLVRVSDLALARYLQLGAGGVPAATATSGSRRGARRR